MPDLERLRSSIEEVGLIQPAILRRKAEKCQIVCGFRRIAVLREKGSPAVEGSVVEEDDEFRLFCLSLHDNLTTRGLNAVEKAIALDKLISRFQIDRSAVITKFLSLFSLETNEKILDTFLSLARMEDEMKAYVLREEVSRSNIRKLAALSAENRITTLSLISQLKLGENSLREILTLLDEISQRNRCTTQKIVGDPQVQAILAQEELTPSQQTERVKRVLSGLRYPRMRLLEERFEKGRKALNLPPGVVVQHPPFFEGKGLKVEIQFKTIEQYQALLSALAALPEKQDFEELIKNVDTHQIL
jgi:ParB-like chromosome segregation protein Spo0J